MNPDEDKVKNYLEKYGLTCKRFSKQEIRADKTTDFRVFRNGEFVFYCEVKSIREDQLLDELLKDAAPGEIVGGGRNDPVFNRLTTAIRAAVKQFDAVNTDQEFPNILALVNHDSMCGFNDLLGVLTGNFYANDGTVHPIYRPFSEGRIIDEKRRVHLFLWLDDHKPDRLLFSQTHGLHHINLCSYFSTDQNEIKQIGS